MTGSLHDFSEIITARLDTAPRSQRNIKGCWIDLQCNQVPRSSSVHAPYLRSLGSLCVCSPTDCIRQPYSTKQELGAFTKLSSPYSMTVPYLNPVSRRPSACSNDLCFHIAQVSSNVTTESHVRGFMWFVMAPTRLLCDFGSLEHAPLIVHRKSSYFKQDA